MSDPTPISPSWTWGSSAIMEVTTPQVIFQEAVSAQLAQISLPEPAVCTIYFQAAMSTRNPADRVRAFTIELTEGVGRVAVPRSLTFQFQPAVDAPLEFTIPFIPLHALQVRVSATVDAFTEDPAPLVRIETYMILSPLTRIPQREQKMTFGMATPGEADDLDDELREELQAEGPTAKEAVMQGRRPYDGVDGGEPVEGDDEEDDDEEDGPQVQRVPAWLLQVVDQLTSRYGRKPSKTELRQAVQRLKARRARRLATRGR